MKILHIISSAGFFGAENVLHNLIKLIKAHKKHTAYLICLKSTYKPDPEIYYRAKEEGISASVFTCYGKIDLKVVFQIKQFIKLNKIDVIHTHNYKSNFYGLIASKLTGVPIIATLHGWTAENKKIKLYEMLDSWLISKMDYLVAVSPLISDNLRKRNQEKNRLVFIPNAIDTDIFNFSHNNANMREKYGLKNSIVIGTVGRLTAEKGHRYLIEALKNISGVFPNIKLIIVGSGRLSDTLKAQAYAIGVSDRVIFVGEQNMVVPFYECMDLFVLPSVTEGIPMALLEAMSMGIPVVATKVGGIPYVIADGEGVLVDPSDSTALANAIISLIKSPSLKESIGQRGRNKVLSQFSLPSFHNKYDEIYKKVA